MIVGLDPGQRCGSVPRGTFRSDLSTISSESEFSRVGPGDELPECLRNVILQNHLEHINSRSKDNAKAKAQAKYLKKLSKSIWLPDDPEDPAAFTQTPGFTRTSRKPWCSSKPVYKIVGSFALFMTLGIVIFILYVNSKCAQIFHRY